VVVAERYDTSPVGPHLALGVAKVSRVGLRVGLTFTRMVVNNHDRLAAGRRNWGMPGELGTLSWGAVADEWVLVWHERNLEVRGEARGRGSRLWMPGRLLQHRADGAVVVPTRLRGRARFATVRVAVPDAGDDEWARVDGEHRGVMVSGAAFELRVARRPAGRVWSALAPSPSAEPEATLCE
jgi:hypothetical protein